MNDDGDLFLLSQCRLFSLCFSLSLTLLLMQFFTLSSSKKMVRVSSFFLRINRKITAFVPQYHTRSYISGLLLSSSRNRVEATRTVGLKLYHFCKFMAREANAELQLHRNITTNRASPRFPSIDRRSRTDDDGQALTHNLCDTHRTGGDERGKPKSRVQKRVCPYASILCLLTFFVSWLSKAFILTVNK